MTNRFRDGCRVSKVEEEGAGDPKKKEQASTQQIDLQRGGIADYILLETGSECKTDK